MGQCQETSIKKHPRLIVEVPRGTEQFQLLRNLRVASERFNSQAKDDGRLEIPRLMGEHAFGMRANLGTMAVLLKKTLEFILEMTAQLPHVSAQSVPDHLRGPPMGEFLNWLILGGSIRACPTATTMQAETRRLSAPWLAPRRRGARFTGPGLE